MKPRDYCCCAIPVMNAGIYATLVEQFIVGLLVGVLAVATPSSMSSVKSFTSEYSDADHSAVVGASVPGAAAWILAIIGFVGAGVQIFGFLGVIQVSRSFFLNIGTLN